LLALLFCAPASAAFTAQTTSTSTFTAAASFAPRNLTAPTIDGNPTVGQTLTANPGTWSSGTFTYRWDRNGTTLGTNATYTPSSAGSLRLTVTATNAAGTATATVSTVVAAPPAPANAEPPAIAGQAAFGSPLSGSDGSWSGATTLSRAWLRCKPDGTNCSTIVATTAAYTPVNADIGWSLRYRVTAINASGNTVATSAPTAPLAPRLTSFAVGGLGFSGLAVNTGSGPWSYNTGLPIVKWLEWLRCPGPTAESCTVISGATDTSYTPIAADVGMYLRARSFASQNAVEGVAMSGGTVGPIAVLPPRLGATVTTNIPGAVGLGQVVDGNGGNGMGSPANARTGEWVRLDFGAVKTLVASESGIDIGGSKVVEISTDGSAWTSIPTDSSITYLGYPTVRFNPPVQARYVRVRATGNGVQPWLISEMSFWGS
jgi:hypothetical protein